MLIDFGRVLAPKTDSKMEPKGDQTLGWYPFFRSPKRFENVASFLDRFRRPLGATWTPPGFSFHPFSSPLGHLMALFSPSRAHGNLQPSRTTKKGPRAEKPPQNRRESTKKRQEYADILPRFCREPAEDPPYEPQPRICREPPRISREPQRTSREPAVRALLPLGRLRRYFVRPQMIDEKA